MRCRCRFCIDCCALAQSVLARAYARRGSVYVLMVMCGRVAYHHVFFESPD